MIKKFGFCILALTVQLMLAACSSSEYDGKYMTINETEVNVDADETFYSIDLTSRAIWKAAIEETGTSWLTLTSASGTGGSGTISFSMTKNTTKNARQATIVVTCNGETSKINVTQAASDVDIKSESDVKDFAKYYKPAEFSDMNMLRSDAKWSWFRCKQSDHFFVFWESGFGDNPNASTVPEALRVDIDDMLSKAEQFYKTNVDKLNMAVVGQNKSQLDKYKIEIYLNYSTEWLATGSGYDDVIGALWVNPSSCQPVGSTIGHEIGHSFQYEVYCDKLLNGATDDMHEGFRYGYGENGAGGNAYWEQCAQWQSFQDYPAETFGYHIPVWLANHHRHFNHEWMRYASYWLQYYWTQKHGIDAYGDIWKKSVYPNDPLQTYEILYCNNDLDKLYDELYR